MSVAAAVRGARLADRDWPGYVGALEGRDQAFDTGLPTLVKARETDAIQPRLA